MMASGPLIFIQPVIEAASKAHSIVLAKSEGMALRSVGDDYLYWNSSTASNQLKQREASCSTCDLSGSHLLSTDWNNSPRGHSDPNLPKTPTSYLSTELTFNNRMCNSSVNSSSIIGPASCSPTAFADNVNIWALPWRSSQPQEGLNNAKFFTPNSFFANISSTATTIVNNRGGFLPPSSASSAHLTANPFESAQFARQVIEKTQVGVDIPIATAYPPGGNGSSSTTTSANRMTAVTSVQTKVFSKRSGAVLPLSRRSSATECISKPVRPSSDTNVISLTDNPGTSMLKTDSTFSLETNAQTRTCCFCWCCCCSCSCVRVRPSVDTNKRSMQDVNEPSRRESQLPETRTAYECISSWSESFDNLMKCFSSPDGDAVGQKAFREFLRSEYSEENILFWMACEDLKQETDPAVVEQKARFIYEEYISILSLREVSLDSRVRETINTNMTRPTPHTFDEAQLQIYTLMQRDSYPRFLGSRIYKDLFAMTKSDKP